MWGFLDRPKTEKHHQNGSGNGLKYAVTSMQGWRADMEDAHTAIASLTADEELHLNEEFKGWSYFAVFDGHSGSKVSSYCAKNLLQKIVGTADFKKIYDVNTAEKEEQARLFITDAIHNGFLQIDEDLRPKEKEEMEEEQSGSTAVCIFVSPFNIYFANCGDSRAVLCRGGKPFFATADHKPYLPLEKQRIQQAGGCVMMGRVNGSLAVSRALGDFEYKTVEGKGPTEQLVSPAPQVDVREREADQDEYLVLACDGVWDVMNSEELCKFVSYLLTVKEDLVEVTTAIVDYCLFKVSRDNMSIVLITFPAAPRVSADAVERERQFEEKIRTRAKELLINDHTLEVGRILQQLNEELTREAPDGSFVGSKRSLIEEVVQSQRNSPTGDPQEGGE